MTFRIVERLTRKFKNLFGIHSPSRMFYGPPEDINAIPEMHSSRKSEVEAWNKAVSKYEAGKRNDC